MTKFILKAYLDLASVYAIDKVQSMLDLFVNVYIYLLISLYLPDLKLPIPILQLFRYYICFIVSLGYFFKCQTFFLFLLVECLAIRSFAFNNLHERCLSQSSFLRLQIFLFTVLCFEQHCNGLWHLYKYVIQCCLT